MYFKRGRMYRGLLLFIVLWVALAIVYGVLKKADAELNPNSDSGDSALEIALKMCAVIFTAVATVPSGVLHKFWRWLPVARAGVCYYAPTVLRNRCRPPPYGFSLLKSLQIIIV